MATVTLVFLALASAGTASAQESNMKKMTPVLLVEEVEPCLAVWERLGFEKTMEVPEGDGADGVVHLFAERETFYGSSEIGIRTPCGTHVVFAEFPEGDESGE